MNILFWLISVIISFFVGCFVFMLALVWVLARDKTDTVSGRKFRDEFEEIIMYF